MTRFDEIEALGTSIDEACESGHRETLLSLNAQIEKILSSDLKPENTAILLYWRSNIYGGLSSAKIDNTASYADTQIGLLREAISHESFQSTPRQVRTQILTNLGNELDKRGRCIEAIALYDEALRLTPNYALTLANRGFALAHYARLANDPGHQHMLLWGSRLSLIAACQPNAEFEALEQEEELLSQFSAMAEAPLEIINPEHCEKLLANQGPSLGRSNAERQYRSFCLQEQLFLNPMNDAYDHPIAAADVIGLRSILLTGSETDAHPPLEFSLFNRIKQEFVTARLFYHEYQVSSGVHFSDRDVKLADTYDYTVHGLPFEKLRISFRTAYSILDRIGIFANHYWQLGLSAKSISFPRIWYEPGQKRQVRQCFFESTNPNIHALLEISRDLHDPDRKSQAEPDAKFLSELRNALEHRFVEITDDYSGLLTTYLEKEKSERVRIPCSLFEQKTLKMLKLTRAAIMYLALAVNWDEQLKSNGKEGMIGNMSVPDFDDRHKQRWR